MGVASSCFQTQSFFWVLMRKYRRLGLRGMSYSDDTNLFCKKKRGGGNRPFYQGGLLTTRFTAEHKDSGGRTATRGYPWHGCGPCGTPNDLLRPRGQEEGHCSAGEGYHRRFDGSGRLSGAETDADSRATSGQHHGEAHGDGDRHGEHFATYDARLLRASCAGDWGPSQRDQEGVEGRLGPFHSGRRRCTGRATCLDTLAARTQGHADSPEGGSGSCGPRARCQQHSLGRLLRRWLPHKDAGARCVTHGRGRTEQYSEGAQGGEAQRRHLCKKRKGHSGLRIGGCGRRASPCPAATCSYTRTTRRQHGTATWVPRIRSCRRSSGRYMCRRCNTLSRLCSAGGGAT